MNGVDAVVLATGNDWRAIEAGAHAYAARSGRYTSLSTWYQDEGGNLAGRLEMPMAVGIVGGATRVHPGAQAALKLMGVTTSADLAQAIVSVGLAQNLAALRHWRLKGSSAAIWRCTPGRWPLRPGRKVTRWRSWLNNLLKKRLYGSTGHGRSWQNGVEEQMTEHEHQESIVNRPARPVGIVGYGAYVPATGCPTRKYRGSGRAKNPLVR